MIKVNIYSKSIKQLYVVLNDRFYNTLGSIPLVYNRKQAHQLFSSKPVPCIQFQSLHNSKNAFTNGGASKHQTQFQGLAVGAVHCLKASKALLFEHFFWTVEMSLIAIHTILAANQLCESQFLFPSGYWKAQFLHSVIEFYTYILNHFFKCRVMWNFALLG